MADQRESVVPNTAAEALDLAQRLLVALGPQHPLWPAAARIARRLRPVKHSPDFASILWFGARYSFTASQSAVVRLLWKAWEAKTLDVRRETLTEAASGKDNQRLSDLFRDHPAWNRLIVEGDARGTYRLAEPTSEK